MSADVLRFSPTQAAEYVDKAYETCRARVALLGGHLRKVEADGVMIYMIGMQRFGSLAQLEVHLDRVQGDC